MHQEASAQAEHMFRDMVENNSDGVILIDLQWTIIYVNRIAEEMLGKRGLGVLGRNLWEVFPDAVGGPFYYAYRKARLTRQSTHIEHYSTVLDRWVQVGVYPSERGLAIYFHDFTEQKNEEDKARESEDKFRLFVERITDGFIALDKDFRYIYANKRIGELIHRDPDSLIGKSVWEVFPEAVGSYTYKAFHTAMKEQRFISNMDYYEPLDLWQENYIYPSPEGISVFVRDITERKKLEAQLLEQERTKQLELVASSLEAQEKERTYIGTELHDNVNQIIVATKVMLAHLKENPSDVEQIAQICINNLEKVISENRKLAHELVTPDLSEESLVEEMANLVLNMFSTGVVQTKLDIDAFDESRLDDKRKLAIYRIAQEQFTNIIKHSKAKNVDIRMTTNEDNFSMIISDDGKGVDLTKLGKGIGLKNMEARVRIFDGALRVQSSPDKGFKMEIMIPL